MSVLRNACEPANPRAKRIPKATVFLALACAAPACKGKPTAAPDAHPGCERVEDPEWKIRVFLQPGTKMNPDANGNPLDTQVRLHQVKQPKAAAAITSVSELWSENGKVLADALAKTDEQTAYIGRPHSFFIERAPDTTHLLTVGLLRDASGQGFMQEIKLPVNYTKGSCKVRAQSAAAPCLFILVEDTRIRASFTPPPRFQRTLVPLQECPKYSELFPQDAKNSNDRGLTVRPQ